MHVVVFIPVVIGELLAGLDTALGEDIDPPVLYIDFAVGHA